MQQIVSNKTKLTLHIILLLLTVGMVTYYLAHEPMLGLFLLLFSAIVLGVALFNGVTIAIIISIFFNFAFGSIYFWSALISDTNMFVYLYNEETIFRVIIWMVGQVLVAIFAGRINRLLGETFAEIKTLENEINTLVAVDRVTGFDNKNRMLVELDLEFNRSRRYGDPFSLLLIKWNYYEQFRKLYGQAELEDALQYIAKSLYQVTRVSDQRFRPEQNLFGLLLTHTSVEHIDIIIEKVKRDLSVYTLKNNKLVTLSFEFGYAGYDLSQETAIDLYNEAHEQVENNV